MIAYLKNQKKFIDSIVQKMRLISDSKASEKPGPLKWSNKEIIGHLIDSACNNHRRFVLAALEQKMAFPGYAQDEWVEIQKYNSASWQQLIDLWQMYNHRIIEVLDAFPLDSLKKNIKQHNLNEICWKKPPAGKTVNLEYLVRDYFSHMLHHLKQLAF